MSVTEPEPFVFNISSRGSLAGQTVPPLEPGFGIIGSATAAVIQSGRPDGVLVLRGSNLGNAQATSPTTLTATLPPGIGLGQVSFFAYFTDNSVGTTNLAGPGVCTRTADSVTCTTKQPEEEEVSPGKFRLIPLRPYEYVEMRVGLIDSGSPPRRTSKPRYPAAAPLHSPATNRCRSAPARLPSAPNTTTSSPKKKAASSTPARAPTPTSSPPASP